VGSHSTGIYCYITVQCCVLSTAFTLDFLFGNHIDKIDSIFFFGISAVMHNYYTLLHREAATLIVRVHLLRRYMYAVWLLAGVMRSPLVARRWLSKWAETDHGPYLLYVTARVGIYR